MAGKNKPRQSGQALVHVAILMVVLLGFAALAIDGSHIYLERARMQNAADAGARAGAREICFGDGSQDPLMTAEQYAVSQYGADQAEASYPDGQNEAVRVVAWRRVEMGLANIVGFSEATAGAKATAKCGKATRAGELWPLSVNIDDYDAIECGEKFYVFTDDNAGKGVNCSKCICDLPIPGGGTMQRIGPGARGYLRFFTPHDPMPQLCGDRDNCGSDLKCWFANSHPGLVSVCDVIPGNPGVDADVQDAVNSRDGDRVNIVLWDDKLKCSEGQRLGTCPGDPYRVAGFGCLIAGIGDGKGVWRSVDFQPKPGHKAKDCPKNVKVIVATKECSCNSTTGSTRGETCDPPNVCAVSLIE